MAYKNAVVELPCEFEQLSLSTRFHSLSLKMSGALVSVKTGVQLLSIVWLLLLVLLSSFPICAESVPSFADMIWLLQLEEPVLYVPGAVRYAFGV